MKENSVHRLFPKQFQAFAKGFPGLNWRGLEFVLLNYVNESLRDFG
jgi:hypothetical protein